ncbi:hypothetical protein GOBAR_DD19831 [Gossypium barbadense]|nr:hypothetical protein GOBAR_DD19831 [Gossypium barbadense]
MDTTMKMILINGKVKELLSLLNVEDGKSSKKDLTVTPSLMNALIGDPRRGIQVDLLEFQKLLCCRCCTSSSNALLPSMHDTSIMYKLAQEHGDLINLHDWYQSFKSIVLCPNSKRKPRQSPLPKKRKGIKEAESQSEASIQYPLLYHSSIFIFSKLI